MKLVWMMIVMATGAMLMIAATLLVKPFDLDGRFFYRSGQAADRVASCFFCRLPVEQALQRTWTA